MAIQKTPDPLYTIVCDGCGETAEYEGITPYFDTAETATEWADNWGWNVPKSVTPDTPVLCPDCTSRKADEDERAKSDQEHHQAEIDAAIRYALNNDSREA